MKRKMVNCTLGFKGTDEFIERKQSIEDSNKVVTLFCNAINNLSVEIKGDLDLQIATLSIIKKCINMLVL